MQNHFDLFQLPQQFALDTRALDAAYKEVQNQVHPDKFTLANPVEKRLAMQWASRANEAYQTLKNPLKRAAYLCELQGVALETESNTAMPMAFLMQQMEWRETLEEAQAKKDVAALEELDATLSASRKSQIAQVSACFDSNHFTQAAHEVRQWMFLEKLEAEVMLALEKIA